jgi:hypothetical protein
VIWSVGSNFLLSHRGVVPELGVVVFDDFDVDSSFWKYLEGV